MSYTGFVKWWNDDAGFGFLTAFTGEAIFTHADEIETTDYPTLIEGLPYEFEVRLGPKGPIALSIRPEGTKPSSTAKARILPIVFIKTFYGTSIRYLEYLANLESIGQDLTISSVSVSIAAKADNYVMAVVFTNN